jgi:hypothetical protein
MACKKYQLTNTGTTDFFFSYKRCSDSMWQYNVQLNPGQTKTIVFEDGTYSSPFKNNMGASVVDLGAFPPTTGVPTPNLNSIIDNQNKSMLLISQQPNSTNWFYEVLNYGNVTITGPVDTNLDYGTYLLYDYWTFTDKGYMLLFYNNSEVVLKVLDFTGNLIDSYSATTNSWEYNYGEFLMYFIDNHNNKVFYSDGINVQLVDLSTIPNYSRIYSWDGITKYGFIINSYTGNTSTYYLLNMNGIKPLYTWDNTLMDTNLEQYQSASFIVVYNYNGVSNYYSFVNIFSSETGELLQSFNVNNIATFTNYDSQFYGENKCFFMFKNGSTYLLYNYDGNSNKLVSLTHDYVNYENYDFRYFSKLDNYEFGTRYPSENFTVVFFDDTYINFGDKYDVSYFDIVNYFDGSNEFSLYQYAYNASNTKSIWIYDYFIGSSYMTFVSSDQSNLQLLTLTNTDQIINYITPLSTLYYFDINYNFVGDNFLFITSTSNGSGNVYVYSSLGTELDVKPWNDGYIVETSFGTVLFYTATGSYYFNTKTNRFNILGEYYYRGPNYFDNKNNHDTGTFLLYQTSPWGFKILTPDNLTSGLFVPPFVNNIDDWGIGNNIFVYLTYNNQGLISLYVYDLNFNLLKVVTTTETSYDLLFVLNNRIYLITNTSNGLYKNYLVTINNTKSVITEDYPSFVANDFLFYWYD